MTSGYRLSRATRLLLWAMILMSGTAFVGLSGGENGLRVWQSFFVNFLFWSGMAQGGLVFAALYDIVGARWGPGVRRLAQAMGAFLPISFVLFFVLFAGAETLFPWVRDPVPGKAAWLNLPFLFSRDAFGILALYTAALAYLYYSLRPELGAGLDRSEALPFRSWRLCTKGWLGLADERARSRRFLAILIPAYLLLYTYIFSLLGFDLVMALDSHFYSSLFGAYFFMSSFYLGLAAIALAALFLRRTLTEAAAIGTSQGQDLAKLLLGFCMVTGDFLWSQYAVIWYGNLPEETAYLIARTATAPWEGLAWAILLIAFVVPFLVLLFGKTGERPWSLGAVAALIVIGIALERTLLVAPALWKGPGLPLGWIELFITLGFFATFALSYLGLIARLPMPSEPSSELEASHTQAVEASG